jgi:hypothetical protein
MNNIDNTPGGADDLGSAGTSYPSGWPRKQRMLRWGVGVTLAGFLVGGGIAWAATSSGGPAASASATTSAAGANGATGGTGTALTGQAAVLNSALNTEASATATLPRLRRAFARLRALGGVDGEFTYHNASGYHTLAFERGTIASLSGNDVVVRAPDGTTYTWLIVSDTVVRHNGSKTTASALATGETVFAGGPVVNGARDARVIVIRAGATDSAQTS